MIKAGRIVSCREAKFEWWPWQWLWGCGFKRGGYRVCRVQRGAAKGDAVRPGGPPGATRKRQCRGQGSSQERRTTGRRGKSRTIDQR